MIKIKIVAVGRVKEKYFTEGIAEYQKRLNRFCSFEICEVKEENYNDNPTNKDIEDIKEKEGERILKEAKGYVFAMDRLGVKLDSLSFAEEIRRIADGVGVATFVIGGSYGLSKKVLSRADRLISFSDMTFPHTLFRLILTEQIYRAFTIINNSAYHK